MEIKVIDKKNAEMISKAAMEKLRQVASELGLDVTRGSGRFSTEEFSFKVTFQTPIKVTELTSTSPISNDDIKFGFAKRGTPAIFSDGREVVLIEARRLKYLFYFVGNPDKQFVARFGSFRPIESK